MAAARHRGAHTESSPRRGWLARALAAIVLVGLAGGSLAATRALAGGRDDPSSSTFTGVVTQFADGGALMCVRRSRESGAPFCDQVYVRPGMPEIHVGDRVLVTTITSRDKDGEVVSGILASPVS